MKRGPSMKTMAITAAALLFSLLTAAVSPARSEALPATFITVNGNGGARGRGRRLVPGLLLQPQPHQPITRHRVTPAELDLHITGAFGPVRSPD